MAFHLQEKRSLSAQMKRRHSRYPPPVFLNTNNKNARGEQRKMNENRKEKWLHSTSSLKNKMRITKALLLVFFIVLATSTAVFASNRTPDSQEIVYDEAEYYAFLSEASEDELAAESLTVNDASRILEEFDRAIYLRASMSYSELKGLGYTDEKIKIIKTIDEREKLSEEQIRAITATCTGSISSSLMNGTYCTFTYHWNWNNCPVVTLTDEVAAKWIAFNSSGLIMDSDIYSSTCYVSYYYGSVVEHVGSATKDSSNESFYALGYRFSTLHYFVGEDPDLVYSSYAKTGSMTVTLYSNQNASFDHIKVIGKYGHTTLFTSSIGFSVSSSNSLAFSFTPSKGITTNAVTRVRIDFGGAVSPF